MRPVSSSLSALSSSRSAVRRHMVMSRLVGPLTLSLLLSACADISAQDQVIVPPITQPVVVTPPPPVPPTASLNPSALVFSGVKTDTSTSQILNVENKGTTPLTVTSLILGGTDAAAFVPDSLPTKPVTLAPGEKLQVGLKFSPNGKEGVLRGSLNAQVQDAAQPLSLNLSGLSAKGLEGEFEPPLAQVVQALGYSTNVGSVQLLLGTSAPLLGQEVSAQLFRKTGSGPVSLTPVARYSPAGPLPFGLFTLPGGKAAAHQVGVVADKQYQTLNPQLDPKAAGNVSFDPGSEAFGVYTAPTAYSATSNYTQDSLNTGPTRHAMRVYPVFDLGGKAQPGYLIALEASSNGDYQDVVFLLSGAEPIKP